MVLIGKALRLVRNIHDKQLREVSAAIGFSCGYLSDLENCKKEPSIDFVEKFSKYFGVSPSSLFFFAENLKSANTKTLIRRAILSFLKRTEGE